MAWGTAVPHAALCVAAILLAGGLVELRAGPYLARAVVKPVALSAGLTGVWVWQASSADTATWGSLVGQGLKGLVPYAAAVAVSTAVAGPVDYRKQIAPLAAVDGRPEEDCALRSDMSE